MTIERSESVAFRSEPTASVILSTAAALTRHSRSSQVVGGALTTMGAIGVVVFGNMLTLVTLLFGVAMLTGAFVVPFTWYAISRRRDLVLAPVSIEADGEGIAMTSSAGTARQPWSVYTRVRETDAAFLLDVGTGANVILARRGMTTEQQAAFRSILTARGLLTRFAASGTDVAWLGIGVAIGIVVAFLPTML